MKIEDIVGCNLTNISTLNPILEFNKSIYITIECFWRLMKDGNVVLSSNAFQNHAEVSELVESLRGLLDGTVISSITVREEYADLYLVFSNGCIIECLSDSGVYESWTISGPDNLLRISLPGGNLM